jgi:hypothetical protein
MAARKAAAKSGGSKSAAKGAAKGGASKGASKGAAKSAAKGAAKGGASKGAAKSTRANHGNAWSTDDMKQLRQLARERTLIRVAAEKLGRSLDSVKSKASEEGISFKGPRRGAAKKGR